MSAWRPNALALWALSAWFGLAALACDAHPDRQVVTVFYAASLSCVLSDLKQELEREHPQLDLRLEPSGSMVAARKISELGRRADLVLTADWRVIEDLLVPEHTSWSIRFAANEIVLAHAEHSRFTEEIDSNNWPQVLTRESVRLGRADENTAPIGFQTLQLWELAARTYPPGVAGPDLAKRLREHCRPEHVAVDIAELATLLQTRAIDYTFVFRSTAEEHRLKITRLPAAIHLGDPDRAAEYARVQVPVRLAASGAPRMLAGAPILYGLTIPTGAPNPVWAERVAAELLGPRGQRLLRRSGFGPLAPAIPEAAQGLPPGLAGLVRKAAAR